MKPLLLIGALLFALAFPAMSDTNASSKNHGHLRHVVAFKFKDTASPAEVKKVETAFRALKSKIPQIASLESGTNNSPENLNKGCTHGWILTFTSEKDRDAYLVHPDHQEFGKLVRPLVADVFVIDFWAK
jgi:hypothetical protein